MLDSFFKGLADSIGAVFAHYFVSLNEVMTLAKSAPSSDIQGFPSLALWEASKGLSSSVGTGVASVVIFSLSWQPYSIEQILKDWMASIGF